MTMLTACSKGISGSRRDKELQIQLESKTVHPSENETLPNCYFLVFKR
jgi:hypothetical protein